MRLPSAFLRLPAAFIPSSFCFPAAFLLCYADAYVYAYAMPMPDADASGFSLGSFLEKFMPAWGLAQCASFRKLYGPGSMVVALPLHPKGRGLQGILVECRGKPGY